MGRRAVRTFFVITIAALVSSGCVVGRQNAKWVMAADVGLIVTGGVLAGSAAAADCEPEDPEAGPFNIPGMLVCGTARFFVATIGIGLLAAGVVGLTVTKVSDDLANRPPEDPGARAAREAVERDRAARERAMCDEWVAKYRSARYSTDRANLLRDMPSDCRVRARASRR